MANIYDDDSAALAFQQELEWRQLEESDLSDEEIYNLKTYGALSPMEFAPDPFDLEQGQCVCGRVNCPEEYSHITSGF